MAESRVTFTESTPLCSRAVKVGILSSGFWAAASRGRVRARQAAVSSRMVRMRGSLRFGDRLKGYTQTEGREGAGLARRRASPARGGSAVLAGFGPDVEVALLGVAVDLSQLVRGELQIFQRPEALLDLAPAAGANQGAGDRGLA